LEHRPLVAVCPVLVERDRELDFLRRAAAAATAGSPQLVVITGEAGAGKSRLARELVAALGEGWQQVRLTEEGGVLVSPGGRHAGVAADLPPAPAIGAVVAGSLREAAEGGPTVALLEDLDRVDPVSVSALGAALDALAGAPVLVLTMLRVRVHPPGSALARAVAELLRHPSANELRLAPLSVSGIAAMAHALGEDLPERAARDLHARTGGNPFFTEEVLLAPADTVPWTVTEAVLGRVGALREDARRVAEILSVAPEGIERETLESLVPDPDAIGAMLDRGIGTERADGRVLLRHALVAEVVAGRLSRTDRVDLHRMLAVALAARHDASPDRLAHHWSAAGDAAEAARWAVVAADRAGANRAYRTATALYRVALAVGDDDELRRAELLDRAAVAAGWAGFEQDALEWATLADASYRRAGESWRAIAMWLSPGLSHVPKPVLDRETLAADTVVRVLTEARDATRRHEYERSAALCRRAIELADERGEDDWKIEAALRLVGAGEADEGEAVLQRLRAAAVAAGDDVKAAHVLSTLAYVHMARGDMRQALVLDRHALAAAHRAGEAAAWRYEPGIASLLAYLGDVEGAEECAGRLLRDESPVARAFAQFPLCIIELERGDLDAATARLERMGAVETLGVTQLTIGVLAARARTAFLSGETATALGLLGEADAVSGELFEATRVDRLVLQARVGSKLGDADVVAAARGALAALAPHGGPEVDAAVALGAGLADLIDGRPGRAWELLDDAARRWELTSRVVHAADTWVHAAEAATAAGDASAREHALERATELATDHGLEPVLARVAAARQVAPAPAVLPVLEPLSEREREIAQLVATGKTNREVGEVLFISEHTVRNQLVAIYDKLGVSRRAELARLLA
jgi:DNA-binding NarL/FixJ family response regulator